MRRKRLRRLVKLRNFKNNNYRLWQKLKTWTKNCNNITVVKKYRRTEGENITTTINGSSAYQEAFPSQLCISSKQTLRDEQWLEQPRWKARIQLSMNAQQSSSAPPSSPLFTLGCYFRTSLYLLLRPFLASVIHPLPFQLVPFLLFH